MKYIQRKGEQRKTPSTNSCLRGVGRGGSEGSDDPPFWGQILYISYEKC